MICIRMLCLGACGVALAAGHASAQCHGRHGGFGAAPVGHSLRPPCSDGACSASHFDGPRCDATHSGMLPLGDCGTTCPGGDGGHAGMRPARQAHPTYAEDPPGGAGPDEQAAGSSRGRMAPFDLSPPAPPSASTLRTDRRPTAERQTRERAFAAERVRSFASVDDARRTPVRRAPVMTSDASLPDEPLSGPTTVSRLR